MIIVILERDYSRATNFQVNHVGGIYRSLGEAEDVVRTLLATTRETAAVSLYFVHDGERWVATSTETGEVLKEYAIQRINF